MQQRRVRLGDILDDYCPRERRITNHAVVAMIEDEVKQTRCTTCDAEHEYKQAKAPAPRKKKPGAAASLVAGSTAAADSVALVPASLSPGPAPLDEVVDAPAESFTSVPDTLAAAAPEEPPVAEAEPAAPEDDWPVHRPLIRATLPRPEGQTPERKEPDFTIRQNGRFDRNGNRHRAKSHGRGQGSGPGHTRFGQHSGSGHSHRSGPGPGHGAGQNSGQGSRQGDRPHSGQRGGRQGGQGRGPNSGQGRGRRGR
jgi:hypothetical protein